MKNKYLTVYLAKAICIILLLISVSGFSQTNFSYSYDAVGNRIQRIIVMDKSAAINTNDSTLSPGNKTTEEFYTDVIDGKNIKIFPNPTQGLLTIQTANLGENETISFSMYDMGGNKLLQKDNGGATTVINLTSYKSNTYILRICYGKSITEWKIIKL